MVRPCGARGFVGLAVAVLHQCIRPLIGACCAPGHHGYQRACDLISGQASTGPSGSPVFARARKTDPPSLRFLSQTSAGNRRWGYVMARSSCCAVPLFGRGAVPSSRPAQRRSRRAQAQSRPAVAQHVRLAPALPGRALTAPSTARGSSRSGDCIVRPRHPKVAPFGQHCPGNAGEFVGERNCQHVVVQPLFGGLDPRR
jgi:hypothetical protein